MISAYKLSKWALNKGGHLNGLSKVVSQRMFSVEMTASSKELDKRK